MLAIQPSPSTPRFAFSPDDEVKIRDVSYRPHERRPDGYIMGRSDGTGAAEFFEDGKLRHLVQKGVLHHEPGAFLSDAERRRRAPRRSVISAAPEAIAHRSKLRLAYVEAFLELEARREIKRTDAAIKAAMGRLQMRATEILGLQNRDERGDRNTCVLAKPVAAISLRRWLKDYEAEGLEGLFDALHRSGNRSRKIGLEELGVMGPLVQRYARENVPKEIIFQDVKSTFETLNEERARKKLAPLEVPSRETIRREIDRLDPYQVHVAHKGEASARKKFAPVGTGLQLTRPLERVEMDEWTIDLISLVTKGGLGKHLTDEDKRQLGLDRKTIRWKASAAICSTTRCIVAMRLTPSATSHSAIQTIDMITRDKGVWTDTFSALSPWDMAGVPELIVTDCGSNFVSYETRAAMQDLGIRVERAPAGVPEVRGRIERFFLTAITSLLPRLFTRAHAGLSFTSFLDAFLRLGSDTEAASIAARRHAERALSLDALDPFANFTMGRSFWLTDQSDVAADWLERATTLNPNYAQGFYASAFTAMLTGDAEATFSALETSLHLSPLDPLLYGVHGVRAQMLMQQGDYQAASRWGDRAATQPGAHYLIAMIALAANGLAGRQPQAECWRQEVLRRKPDATGTDYFTAFPTRDSTSRARIAAELRRHGF